MTKRYKRGGEAGLRCGDATEADGDDTGLAARERGAIFGARAPGCRGALEARDRFTRARSLRCHHASARPALRASLGTCCSMNEACCGSKTLIGAPQCEIPWCIWCAGPREAHADASSSAAWILTGGKLHSCFAGPGMLVLLNF